VKQLWKDRDGVILPYVAIMIVAILGLSALALDASRLMYVQTQLQNAADALALAGAAELDRRPDSIIRAESAIHDLVANPVSGAGIDKAEVASIDFLWSLPASDDLPLTTANMTNDPTLAGYVRVTVRPVAMSMIFPTSLLPGHQTVGVGAQAVAGYDQIVCNASPVFVCNPYETDGMTHYQATQALVAADQASPPDSRLIRLARSQFKSGSFSAGDFGYLEPATGYLPENACGPGGESGIPQALAATRVQACFRLSGVHLLPSDDQPAMDGLNTRFDIYANSFHSCRGYPPDINVRKGFTAFNNVDWCNNAVPASTLWPIPVSGAAALPVDQNMISAAQSFDPNITLGSGTWDCASYWTIAHAVGPGKNSPPPGCTVAATITRYDVYRYELNFLSDRSLGAEYGAPQCVAPGAPNRRIITAAIVNCGSSPVPMLSDAHGVPAAGFGRFFLVLPAESGTNGNPYAEFSGLVKRSDPDSHDMVQLYR
jgi:Flp pilus assembly protein TadG